MFKIFLALLLATSYCLADYPLGVTILWALRNNWNPEAHYDGEKLKQYVREILITGDVLESFPFTEDKSFIEALDYYADLDDITNIQHSFSKEEREAITQCRQVKALLKYRDGAALYELRMEIMKLLRQAGLTMKLFDGIVKKILDMLNKYHILEHFQKSRSKIDQCIDCLSNTFKEMYYRLLEGHKTLSKEVAESVTLFLLETILTLDQNPTKWTYGLWGQNEPDIGDKTLLLHILSFLKQKDAHSGLPQLEGAINKVCSQLLNGVPWLEQTKQTNCNVQDKDGQNALHIAVSDNSVKLCEMLLKRSANVCEIDKNGDSPLHVAISLEERLPCLTGSRPTASSENICRRKKEICKKLIEYGADINLRNSKGNTPLHRAVAAEEKTLAKVILKNEKVLVNRVNNAQQTVLHYACISANAFLIKLLVEKGARTSVSDEFGNRPVHYASCSSPNLDVFSVEELNDINSAGAGWAPLHIALYCNNIPAVRYLLKKDVNINLQFLNQEKLL